jgi:outer membrane protein TolC
MRTVASKGHVAIFVNTILSLSIFLAGISSAQGRPPPGGAQVVPPVASSAAAADDTAPVPVPTDLVQARPGGITADQVGVRAAATSWTAKASEESLRGAAARVDQAWASFLPRLSGLAKYTRLSDFTPPPFGSFGGTAIPGIPLVLDNWLLQATINVPISDYFLRIDQNYTAATRSQDAARWDVVGARATAAANGRAAYYTWLRARGAVIVAVQALNDQRTHLRDARNQFAVGNASRADVLRAETAVASADLALEQAKNLSDLTEKQVRVAIHVAGEEPLLPGEDLETSLEPLQGNQKQMLIEALSARPEIKSADANAESAHRQAAAARAGLYPSLSAFADGIYANPNPRYFPPANNWFGTWDLGAQLTWSPNDTLVAVGAGADADSRVAAIEANKNNVRDGIEVEITQAWENVHQGDFAIESGKRELASAQEAYRVARELFNNGRGTSTTLTDAETDLTRARLDVLNAKADARIARLRLEHALGRDAKPPAR